jgi:hypothetical protein
MKYRYLLLRMQFRVREPPTERGGVWEFGKKPFMEGHGGGGGVTERHKGVEGESGINFLVRGELYYTIIIHKNFLNGNKLVFWLFFLELILIFIVIFAGINSGQGRRS